MLGGEIACRLGLVLYLVTLCSLIKRIILWCGGNENNAPLAIAFFLSTPLIFAETSSLYIDLIWASFALMGILSFLMGQSDSEDFRANFLVAGMLIGFALASKAATFTLLPGMIFIWIIKGWRKDRGYFLNNQILKFVISFFLIGVIPYFTAFLITGNPFFHLYNGVFKSPYFAEIDFLNNVFAYGNSWDILYQITFKTNKYLESGIGAAGFIWLTLFLPCAVVIFLGKLKNAKEILFIGFIGFILTFQFQSYLRYCLPSIIIFIALIGVGIGACKKKTKISIFYWSGLSIAIFSLNITFMQSGNQFYRDFPLTSLIDEASKNKYLYDRLPLRNLGKIINLMNVNKSSVAVFSDPYVADISTTVEHPHWYNTNFVSSIGLARTPSDLLALFKANNIEYVIVDSSWNGINGKEGAWGDSNSIWRVADKKELIAASTVKMFDYGPLTLYKVPLPR